MIYIYIQNADTNLNSTHPIAIIIECIYSLCNTQNRIIHRCCCCFNSNMDLKSIVITVVLLMAAYATFMCEGLPGTTTNPKPINTNTSSAAAQQNGAANATATTSTDAANLLTDAMQKCNQTNPISMGKAALVLCTNAGQLKIVYIILLQNT